MKWFMETPTWVKFALIFVGLGLLAALVFPFLGEDNKADVPEKNGVGVVQPSTPDVEPTPEVTETTAPDAESVPEGEVIDDTPTNELSPEEYDAAQQTAYNGITNYYAISSVETQEARQARIAPFFEDGSTYLSTSPLGDEFFPSDGATLDSAGVIRSEIPVSAAGDTFKTIYYVDVSIQIAYTEVEEAPQVFQGSEMIEVEAKKIGDSWKIVRITSQGSDLQ